jgi:uncharacterized protein
MSSARSLDGGRPPVVAGHDVREGRNSLVRPSARWHGEGVSASLRQRMHDDLAAAMRARDRTRVGVLRTTLGAVANAEAVDGTGATVRTGLLGDVERRQLTADDIRAIIDRERRDLAAAAEEMRAVGQVDEADELVRRVGILEGYLRP